MAGAVLRGAGWDTRDVEATPAAEVAELARQTDPALVVISVTVQAAADAVAELQDALRGVLAAPVLVGGPGESLAVLLEDAEAARAGRSAGSGTAPSAA
jgi:methylmalonyl-CoA mutase cobalamin-binding subunit